MAKTKAILVGSSMDPRMKGGPMEGMPPPKKKQTKKGDKGGKSKGKKAKC